MSDLSVGLAGFHVIDVSRDAGTVRVVVETPAQQTGCRACGVVAHSHGRREVRLVDVPSFGRPVTLIWRKRTWRCAEEKCATKSFTEQCPDLAGPRALLTVRACWWAITQLRASTPRLNRPGSDGGSQSMEDESHGSTQEVPRRAA